jgi:hypothetical protein
MNTKALQEWVLMGETFTNKISYNFTNVLNTLARIHKMDRKRNASNIGEDLPQTNKGGRRGVTPKCLPSKL